MRNGNVELPHTHIVSYMSLRESGRSRAFELRPWNRVAA